MNIGTPKIVLKMPLFCEECGVYVSSHLHRLSHKHKENCCVEFQPNVKLVRVAFNNRLVTYRLSSSQDVTDVKLFLEKLKPKIITLIQDFLGKYNIIKISMELFGLYILGSQSVQDIKSFNSRYEVITRNSDLADVFDRFRQLLVSKSTEFKERDSGWSLSKLLFLELNINKCKSSLC